MYSILFRSVSRNRFAGGLRRLRLWPNLATAAVLCVLAAGDRLQGQERVPQGIPTPQDGPPLIIPTPEELEQGLQPLTRQSLDTRLPDGLRPPDVAGDRFRQGLGRSDVRGPGWQPTAYYWEPSLIRTRPLYFEDVLLERYGQTHHPLVQPGVSAARAAGDLVSLPYEMTLHPPWQRRSTLGYYRPGSPVPPLRQRLPWRRDAAFVESGVMVGLIFLIP